MRRTVRAWGHLVPTLCVGTHVWTLCVPSCNTSRQPLTASGSRAFRDAERPDVRSHAERGNEEHGCTQVGLGCEGCLTPLSPVLGGEGLGVRESSEPVYLDGNGSTQRDNPVSLPVGVAPSPPTPLPRVRGRGGKYALLTLALLVAANPLRAGSAETRVVWVDGKPNAEVRIQADGKSELKEIQVPLELFDAKNFRVWSAPLKVPVTAEKTWTARLPMPITKDLGKQHRLHTQLLLPNLNLDYTEDVNFSSEKPIVQSFGLRTLGTFPQRKVYFTLELQGFKGTEFRDVPVNLTLRDGEENQVLSRVGTIRPANESRQHLLDVTPDAGALGPFKLEAGIESDAYSIFHTSSQSFGQPNALVPFTGFEHGDPGIWFAAEGNPANYRSYDLFLPGQEQLYYSEHLRDLMPRDNPRVSYDHEVKHSGRQSLRLDYIPTGEAHAWSVQSLPGKPLYLGLWVKGNGSKDQLTVYFEDNVNYTNAAWQRRANFSSAPVCTLDFDGWRHFRVPVLGLGLQVSGLKGSTDKIDAPIRLMSLTVAGAAPLSSAGPYGSTTSRSKPRCRLPRCWPWSCSTAIPRAG